MMPTINLLRMARQIEPARILVTFPAERAVMDVGRRTVGLPRGREMRIPSAAQDVAT
jgi:hypothetical protein